MIESIILIIFVTLALLFLSISTLVHRKYGSEERQIRKRLEELRSGAPKTEKQELSFIIRDEQMSRIPQLDRILKKQKLTTRIAFLLEQAGVTIKVGQLILLMIICAVTGFLALYPFVGFFLAAVIALLVGSAPYHIIKMKKNKRIQQFTRQFPDAIDMMTGALKSGHAFNKAMQLVALEAPNPVGIEFRKAFEEQNLGIPLFEALEKMAQRIESSDLRLFVTAVLLQRETGGNLTEILNKIGYTIRQRFKLMGQIKAFTAQGRLSAWIISALPFVLLLILTFINPDYTRPLFEEKIGRMLLGAAVVLELIGFVIIRKIITIKLS